MKQHKLLELRIGDMVYLKTDPEQLQRIITGILERPNNSIIYFVSIEALETQHFGIELDTVRDIIKATSN